MDEKIISRREFLKKTACGALGLLALAKFGSTAAIPAIQSAKSEDGIIKSTSAPADRSKMWLNTGSDANTFGVEGLPVPAGALCYFDAAQNGWKPTTPTWS